MAEVNRARVLEITPETVKINNLNNFETFSSDKETLISENNLDDKVNLKIIIFDEENAVSTIENKAIINSDNYNKNNPMQRIEEFNSESKNR